MKSLKVETHSRAKTINPPPRRTDSRRYVASILEFYKKAVPEHLLRERHSEDPRYDRIKEFVINEQRVNQKLIRDEFCLTRNEAKEYMELLEKDKIITPAEKGKKRQILITPPNTTPEPDPGPETEIIKVDL